MTGGNCTRTCVDQGRIISAKIKPRINWMFAKGVCSRSANRKIKAGVSVFEHKYSGFWASMSVRQGSNSSVQTHHTRSFQLRSTETLVCRSNSSTGQRSLTKFLSSEMDTSARSLTFAFAKLFLLQQPLLFQTELAHIHTCRTLVHFTPLTQRLAFAHFAFESFSKVLHRHNMYT